MTNCFLQAKAWCCYFKNKETKWFDESCEPIYTYCFMSNKTTVEEPTYEEVEESIFPKYQDKSVQVPEIPKKPIFLEVTLKPIPKKFRYDNFV